MPTPNTHFDSVSRQYAESRPTYPAELFAWLAGQCPQRTRAWDCGTGSGQAAVDLARHFDQVIATDASAAQIAQARPCAGVEYRVAPAEASGLDDASVDLVTVAQALHWFDLPAFHAEVRRVLRADGLLAVWTYGILHLPDPVLDAPLQHFYHDVVGPWWPAERRHVETGYRDLPFPFPRLAAPPFAMHAQWSLEQLAGYLRSWSATARYREQHRTDPVDALLTELARHWPNDGTTCRIHWPLSLQVGRHDARMPGRPAAP